VSRNTVRLALAPVRALFATAVEDGVIRSNPAAGVRLPHVPEPEGDADRTKALTEEELERLILEIPPEWRPLVALLGTTGLRVSEGLALRWRDVDFGTKRVLVRRSVNGTTFSPPKSRYGRREVPLAEGVARALWRLRKASSRAGADELVFTTRDGEPLDRKNLFNRVLKPAARRAGVPWAGFHTLRHTCATMLFRSGLNAKQVQVWLGHHSPAFTLAVYVHLLPDDLPEPIDPPFVQALEGGNKVGTRETEIARKPVAAEVAV
jgi:integrase